MGRSTILLWFALALLVVCSALAEAPAEQLLSNAPDLGNSLVESSSLQDQRQSLKERELLLLSQRESEDRERASIERLVLDVESRPLLPVENSPLSGLFGPKTHSSRSTQAPDPVIIRAQASWTNATFQAAVCSQVANDTSLQMFGLPRLYFAIPSCVATYPLTLTGIVGEYLILEDFNQLPVGLVSLQLANCIVAPSNLSSEANNGFDPDGSVNWNELFSIAWNLQTLNLNICGLRGVFPTAFPLPHRLNDFQVMFNQLTGSISPTFLDNWNRSSLLLVRGRGNRISGTLPAELFRSFRTTSAGTGQSLHLDFSSNLLSGSIPSQWYPANQNWRILILELQGNGLTGSIPSDFLPPNVSSWSINIDLSINQLSGTIPPALFHNCFSTTTWWYMRLAASNNRLTGTLPPSILTTWPTIPSDILALTFTNNDLTGTIPPTMLSPSRNVSFARFFVYLDRNRLTGTIPEKMFWNEDNTTGKINAVSFTGSATVSLGSNQLEGSIPPKLLTYLTAPSTATLQFLASQNRFDGTIPEASFGPAALEYVVSLNPNITGTIPPSWFAATNLRYFGASGTGLTGDLPAVLPYLRTLDLSNTKLDFCSYSSKASLVNFSPTGTCSVYGTSACGCSANYTQCGSCCTGTAPENFECVDGAWVSTVSVTAPVIVIPSTTTPVVIVGDLTTAELVITGIGSTVIVQGSVFNLTTLSVVFGKDDLKDLSQAPVPLLTIRGGDNATSAQALAAVQVQTRVQNSCKSVKTKSYVEGNTLYGMFVVSKGTCDRWWIITVAVVGGVLVILLVVGLVVLLTRKPSTPTNKSKKAAVG